MNILITADAKVRIVPCAEGFTVEVSHATLENEFGGALYHCGRFAREQAMLLASRIAHARVLNTRHWNDVGNHSEAEEMHWECSNEGGQ